MTTSQTINKAIAANLKFIHSHQQPNGSFLGYLPGDNHGHGTIFTPSLIGSALSGLPATQTAIILKPLVLFLLGERSTSWSFNYWPKASPEYKQRPYPDDLDDTFCALAAIHLANPKQIKPGDFADIIKLLVAQENSEGGPYRTWVIQKSAGREWQDVDLAVNSNISYYLRLNGLNLPNLQQFTETAILNQTYSSPFYPPDFPLMYFFARSYQGDYTENLKQDIYLKRLPNGSWNNPTNTALAVTALLNLGEPATNFAASIKHLTSWKASEVITPDPVYIEENNRTIGAPALSAAFIVEALYKYAQASMGQPAKVPPIGETTQEQIYAAAVQNARQRFANTDTDLHQDANGAIDKILERDTDKQMGVLGYRWAASRSQETADRLMPELIQLGTAGLFGWLAYTIYDDIIDQTNPPRLLPVANVALRSLESICWGLFGKSPHQYAYISGLLDRIESANAWELANCRFEVKEGIIAIAHLPDFSNLAKLADRSFGHALGPIAVNLLDGEKPDSNTTRQTEDFFRHYLIARQLNDDVHDWEDDLSRGHLNVISVQLLQAIKPDLAELDIAATTTSMRAELWNNQISNICKNITDHTDAARQALAQITKLNDSKVFTAMLEPIDDSVHQALTESRKMKKFIRAFEADKTAPET